MNNKQIRYRNLQCLYKKMGCNWRALSEKTDVNVKYFNQCKPDQGGVRNGMGDKIAARIESAFDKPAGWMDELHPDEYGDVFEDVEGRRLDRAGRIALLATS